MQTEPSRTRLSSVTICHSLNLGNTCWTLSYSSYLEWANFTLPVQRGAKITVWKNKKHWKDLPEFQSKTIMSLNDVGISKCINCSNPVSIHFCFLFSKACNKPNLVNNKTVSTICTIEFGVKLFKSGKHYSVNYFMSASVLFSNSFDHDLSSL